MSERRQKVQNRERSMLNRAALEVELVHRSRDDHNERKYATTLPESSQKPIALIFKEAYSIAWK